MDRLDVPSEAVKAPLHAAGLGDARILILDEATLSVDVETEKKIQEAIARLVKDRTTIAIAHRLFVLKDGRGVEYGTHEELIEKKGIYYKLVETQRELSQIRSEAAAVAG